MLVAEIREGFIDRLDGLAPGFVELKSGTKILCGLFNIPLKNLSLRPILHTVTCVYAILGWAAKNR
jgi:hypothetical protein